MKASIVLCACVALLVATPALAQSNLKATLLERAGWDALAAGQPAAAAEAFREAIDSDPKNARLHLGAGTAAYLERRDAEAQQALEQALRLDPKLTRARALLGRMLYRRGHLRAAIRTYEALNREAPDDDEARATVDRWRREAELESRMRVTVGWHFDVSFEGPAEEQLATQALESVERAYWRIGEILATYPIEPIRVVLYTTEQFRDITRSPPWAAGAYDGTIRIPMRGALNDPDELDRILAHEFTHALVHSLAPRRVPTWLDEGLASALERKDLDWAEARVRAARPQMSPTALQRSFRGLSRREAQLAYATSALAVQQMIDDVGGFAIANLLRDLGDGASFETAFARRIFRSFAEFQASLVAPIP